MKKPDYCGTAVQEPASSGRPYQECACRVKGRPVIPKDEEAEPLDPDETRQSGQQRRKRKLNSPPQHQAGLQLREAEAPVRCQKISAIHPRNWSDPDQEEGRKEPMTRFPMMRKMGGGMEMTAPEAVLQPIHGRHRRAKALN